MHYLSWFKRPRQLRRALFIILPLLFSQLLQRVYPIIDSRYISSLGKQPLLIHSLTYNFVAFGALIGMASATSCLIFWRRKESVRCQGSIFIKVMLLAILLCIIAVIPIAYFSANLLHLYKVSDSFLSLGSSYLFIALLNMLLQAIYGAVDGVLVASGQQSKSLFISGIMLAFHWLIDVLIIRWGYHGGHLPSQVAHALIAIGASTSVLLSLGVLFGAVLVVRKIEHWHVMPYRDMFSVWSSEMGVYIIKGLIPFVYAYQLARVSTSEGFFATFQLSLQLAYVFCLPLLAAMQIAVREASAELSHTDKTQEGDSPEWWREFFYIGLLPTLILLLLGAVLYPQLFKWVYNYVPAGDQWAFIPLYFIACMFGQLGSAVGISIRARKASYLLTFNFFINQLVFMLGFTQILIWLHFATPTTVGWVTIVYCAAQLIMNALSIRRLRRKEKSHETFIQNYV